MMERMHQMIGKAGMPDDRVDYILKKWLKQAYPEAFDKKEIKPDANGCYDKGEHGVWCPKGDDWYCVKNCKDKGESEDIKTKEIDPMDCYFDAECRNKVDWDKVGEFKKG